MNVSTRVHEASILGFSLVLVLVLAVLVLAICPPTMKPPEDRGPSMVSPAVEPSAVLGRLREIRWKYQRIHPEIEEAPDAPGSVAELDRLMRDLISDYDIYVHKDTR